jgi:aspartate aminotransferase
MRLANRNQRLGAARFSTVLAKVQDQRAKGRRIIPMHAGQPDFDTPANIIQAAIAALQDGHTHYAPTLGIPVLREAVAEDIASSHNIDVDPDCVVITPGAKPMIFHAILALCQAGDEVICPDPCYPIYASLAEFAGAKAIHLPFLSAERFRLDTDRLRSLITPRTKMIVLNTPCNPTGVILEESELEAIAELALEYDLFILSDEIYRRLIYEQPFISVASLPGLLERTILVDGFSKTFAMTGWRLGYGVLPKPLVPAIERLILNTLSSTNTFIQYAGVEALRGPQDAVLEMVSIFQRRRDLLVEGLRNLPGFHCHRPQGAFYVFARASDFGLSSEALSDFLLEEAGVATYAGATFGNNGEGHIRFSFACSENDLQEGLQRIESAMAKHFDREGVK